MEKSQTASLVSQLHIETIEGTTYEVTSNYIRDISLLDLFKEMLKRDFEIPES